MNGEGANWCHYSYPFLSVYVWARWVKAMAQAESLSSGPFNPKGEPHPHHPKLLSIIRMSIWYLFLPFKGPKKKQGNCLTRDILGIPSFFLYTLMLLWNGISSNLTLILFLFNDERMMSFKNIKLEGYRRWGYDNSIPHIPMIVIALSGAPQSYLSWLSLKEDNWVFVLNDNHVGFGSIAINFWGTSLDSDPVESMLW